MPGEEVHTSQAPHTSSSTSAATSSERCILLLCDSLNSVQDGIGGANRSLAMSLARFKGIRVASTVFCAEGAIPVVDRTEMDENNITIITPASQYKDPKELYKLANEEPETVFPSLAQELPSVTHIVGHSPITAEAALKLQESKYPRAKLILFYHVIPDNVAWMTGDLAYALPTDMQQVQLAEKADVVYSVSEKIHWFYTAKFRNRAQKDIDHRLFLPLCIPEVFDIKRQVSNIDSPAKILTVCTGSPSDGSWEGLDIAACAVNKVFGNRGDLPPPELVVGGIPEENIESTQEALSNILTEGRLRENLKVNMYTSTEGLFKDLKDCALCIIPNRAEPYGYRGLFALSAGVPTLLSEDSALAPMIRRLTSEPEQFLVPVTPTTSAYRQDASVWRDRILNVLSDPQAAHTRAQQLQVAMRRDGPTKETHDNIICYTLGGIRLVHHANFVDVVYRKDEDKELVIQRDFNAFLSGIMQQCWRLKHHPLTRKEDLMEVVPGVHVPTEELIKKVTNHIEAWDRRIVGFEEETGSFIIYCPTAKALSDLWAMCDRINDKLVTVLLSGSENVILNKFGLKNAVVRTEISGPEFLRYKSELQAKK